MIEDILAKAGSGALLERQDALRLLEVATGSAEYYALLGAANAYARTAFRGRGVILRRSVLTPRPVASTANSAALPQTRAGASQPASKRWKRRWNWRVSWLPAGSKTCF